MDYLDVFKGHKLAPLALSFLLAALLGATGCSDDSSGTDAGPSGDGKVGLWPCSNPGGSCNPHDTCAIDPVCGEDKLCHVTNRQNCDDGLDCTEDSCGGLGLCKNEPKPNTCALLVKGAKGSEERCFNKGDINPDDPCKQCAPDVSSNKWSGRNGGSCDDGDPCTKDDYCKEGFCEGTYFGNVCNDKLSCTDDICDGKGGCGHTLRTDGCLIKGTCYKDGDPSADGCATCDAQTDQHAWTPLSSSCKIGNTCYPAGAFDPSGCGVCDPAKDPSGWSLAAKTCLIGGICYKSGDPDKSGCGECTPSVSTTSFTPTAGKCLIGGVCQNSGATSAGGCSRCDPATSGDRWTPVASAAVQTATFETDLDGYTVSAANSGVGWQVDTKQAKSGTKSLYYGNPTTGSYDSGAANSGTATSPAISLPAGQKAELTFWLYMDTEASAGFDTLTVKAGTQLLWTKGPQTLPAARYRSWVPITIDLSALAGQSVSLEFAFDTKDNWSNGGLGVFIDDITVLTSCGSI